MPTPFVSILKGPADAIEAVGDYSSAPALFSAQAPLTGRLNFSVARMLIYVQDTGSFDAEKYGNNITVTNGIEIYTANAAGEVMDPLTPEPIRTSGDWASIAYDTQFVGVGTGDEYMSTRWTFSKFVEGGLTLEDGEQLVVKLNDDFTGLNAHRFTIQGSYTFSTSSKYD